MLSLSELRARDDSPVGDQIIVLDQVPYAVFQRLLETRGDKSVPRMAFLEGRMEILVPSSDHERIKSRIGRLVEAYCMHAEVEFDALGSWTLEDPESERAVEPDECYVFGTERAPRPHLAIEVEWTRGGLDKLQIYRKLGVAEVWWWKRGVITAYELRDDAYQPIAASEVLPGVDLAQLASFVDRPTASQAIREYTQALRGR